jgi:hypothetical protein
MNPGLNNLLRDNEENELKDNARARVGPCTWMGLSLSCWYLSSQRARAAYGTVRVICDVTCYTSSQRGGSLAATGRAQGRGPPRPALLCFIRLAYAPRPRWRVVTTHTSRHCAAIKFGDGDWSRSCQLSRQRGRGHPGPGMHGSGTMIPRTTSDPPPACGHQCSPGSPSTPTPAGARSPSRVADRGRGGRRAHCHTAPERRVACCARLALPPARRACHACGMPCMDR